MDHVESLARLNAIIESAVDGIITINECGIIDSANRSAAILFGYHQDELIGKNVSILMPEPHRKMHDQYIQNYLTTGLKKIIGIGREVMGQKKDGSLFPFLLSISEVRLKNNKLFTGVVHDISKLKEAEKKLININKLLEKKVEERTDKLAEVVNKLLNTNQELEDEIKERTRAEEALKESRKDLEVSLKKEKELGELKSRFVSMASHEFRTPLGTILSSTSLLERYTTSETQEKRARHIKKIKSAVHNLTSILNDFLSIGKWEEGKINYTPSSIDVIPLLHEVKEQLESHLKKGQEIIIQKEDDLHSIYVQSDENLLTNVFVNLISNAIKYSPEGSPIMISFNKQSDKVKVSIIDRGIGIPQNEQKHLFTKFFRASNAEYDQGTGLGLHIVKNYIDLMKGDINFCSKENEGSTFHVYLLAS